MLANLLILWTFSLAPIAPVGPVVLNAEQTLYPLAGRLEILEDPSGKLTLAQIKATLAGDFMPVEYSALGLALAPASSTFWLRFSLHNPTSEPLSLTLIVRPRRNKEAVLYVPAPDQMYQEFVEGYQYAFNERSHPRLMQAFEIIIPAQEQFQLYLKLRPYPNTSVFLDLWKSTELNVRSERNHLLFGLFFGAMVIMIFYNFFIFLVIRDIGYLYYVAFVSCFTFYLFTESGFTGLYLWPSADFDIITHMINALNALTILCAVLYTRTLLDTPTHMHRLDMVFKWLVPIAFLLIPASLLISAKSIWPFIATLDIVTVLFVLTIGVNGWQRQLNAAKYYLIAWLMLCFGFIVNIFVNAGWLPVEYRYFPLLGALMEVTLFSFALADRINKMRQKNLRIQSELLATQRALNEDLEKQVAERTEKLEKANKALKQLSIQDGLTNLFNRRHFDFRLSWEWRRLQRSGLPVSLIMCDVDYFKNYNDTYGHPAGDECLRQVAKAIRLNAKRSYDVPARYGGEEFAILLPYTAAEEACKLAEDLRLAVEKLAIPHAQSKVKNIVSISLGVSTLVPCGEGYDEKMLIRLADEALYDSKGQGRDRVNFKALETLENT